MNSMLDPFYKLAKFVTLVKGGVAEKRGITENDIDPDQLKRGMEVEREHTDNPEEAKTIALDHLAEFANYYTALDEMEAKLKAKRTAGASTEEKDEMGSPPAAQGASQITKPDISKPRITA